ncbi:hypothetical protein TYRP_013869 [Tyrophagus putrescentiae]|nr:hypothetical protein TYRP_013869 [Tyrophagus putrescentiae]
MLAGSPVESCFLKTGRLRLLYQLDDRQVLVSSLVQVLVVVQWSTISSISSTADNGLLLALVLSIVALFLLGGSAFPLLRVSKCRLLPGALHRKGVQQADVHHHGLRHGLSTRMNILDVPFQGPFGECDMTAPFVAACQLLPGIAADKGQHSCVVSPPVLLLLSIVPEALPAFGADASDHRAGGDQSGLHSRIILDDGWFVSATNRRRKLIVDDGRLVSATNRRRRLIVDEGLCHVEELLSRLRLMDDACQTDGRPHGAESAGLAKDRTGAFTIGYEVRSRHPFYGPGEAPVPRLHRCRCLATQHPLGVLHQLSGIVHRDMSGVPRALPG